MAAAQVQGTGERADAPGGEVRLIREDARTVVWLSGEHDLTTTERLTAVLAEASAVGESAVVVDLSEARFIDASTIGAILGCQRRLRSSNRDLALRNPSPLPLRVIEVCGLASLVEGSSDGSSGSS